VSEKLKYVEIKPRTRAELEQQFGSLDPNVVCDALYSAAQHEPDWRWSQNQCLKMLQHESHVVRTGALIALGEIAIFQGQIDSDVVLPRIQQCKSDPALAPTAQDAIDDIEGLQRSE